MVFHTNAVLGVSVNFEEAFERLLGHEGDFVDHADDPGGATRWGITERTARAHGYTGPMRDLPVCVARGIAKIAYWDAVKAEQLPAAVRYAVLMQRTTLALGSRSSGSSKLWAWWTMA